MTTISLNGDWQLTGITPRGERKLRLVGRVPGHVHSDLERAGQIPDPFWRDQALACQWVEEWDWHYEREFMVPEELCGQWVMMRFDGIDTFATIRLNGEIIGTVNDMFIPYEFEVGRLLQPGRNHLAVEIISVHKALQDKPIDKYWGCFVKDGLRSYSRKMQCTFGWDWVHRLVSAGIWQSVTLTDYDAGRIEDLFVYTKSICERAAVLGIEFETTRRGNALRARIEILDPAGTPVWINEGSLDSDSCKQEAHIAVPQLWWPVGYGEQPLYTSRVTLLDDNGTCVDTRQVQTGIRTAAIEQIPDDVGASFTIVINGIRIFAKGGNWVPADPFPSRITNEKYDRLIKLATDARMNLLRCWGGGIYEPAPFWEACNKYGMMISQDFLLACASYPETDPEFRALLQVEFAQAIRLLRNHPSLIFWSGDNESTLWGPDGMSVEDGAWINKSIAVEITAPLCAALDPTRIFRLSSPFGGKERNATFRWDRQGNNSMTIGDAHCGPYLDRCKNLTDMHGYRDGELEVGRFMSECGPCWGAPSRASLSKFMAETDFAQPDMWEFHTKDNAHPSDPLTNDQVISRWAHELYGDTDDIELEIRHKEYVGYEFNRLTLELARRHKFYCSGVQMWMYNDCWPASGLSMVDYYLKPKASYYAMKAACRPVITAITTENSAYHIWVCSDLLTPVSGVIELRVQPSRGDAKWLRRIPFTLDANSASRVISIAFEELHPIFELHAILVCDLRYAENGWDRATFFHGLPRETILAPAHVSATVAAHGSTGTITLTADHYARVVQLEADLDFEDNYFDLLPGETRTIVWTSQKGNVDGKEIVVQWWNQ